MNTRHSRGISHDAAELLLDGHADPDTDQLARILAAATAPARDGELAGEQMAVAAFEASRLVPVATSVTSKKEHTSMLAKLFTAKVIASSVAALATGGVALAASTSAFSHSPHVATSVTASASPTAAVSAPASTPPSSPATSEPSSGAIAPQPKTSSVAAQQPTSSTPTSAAATLPRTAAGLCKALAGDVASTTGSSLSPSGLVAALSKTSVAQTLSSDSSEFGSLISTAQSAANVPDYCALVLDLPQLPDPSQLAQLPGSLLGQLLTALPASTLAQILTSLPSSTLSQVLTAVPASSLSTILTSLPSSTVSQLLNELPTSVLSQLPTSVLSQLPQSVLSQLPTSILSQL